MSLAERAKSLNTLACVLQGLQGLETTIELRNECSLFGQVDSVDSSMNIHMSKVTLTTVHGNVTKFESFYVKGKNLRYVHIPDEMDVVKAAQSHIAKADRVVNYQEKQGKKLSKWNEKLNKERAEKRRLETLKLAKEAAAEPCKGTKDTAKSGK